MKLENAKIIQPSRAIHREAEDQRPSLLREDTSGEYYLIDVNDLRPYHNQARKFFDQDSLQELAATIKEHGIRQPLTVEIVEDEPGQYEIISGERRWRAAQLAGLQKVPCIIFKNKDSSDAIALIENLQREDLHPIELGHAYKNLLEKGVFSSMEHLADRLHISRSSISECISFSSSLPKDIQILAMNSQISDRQTLRELKSLPDSESMRTHIGKLSKTSQPNAPGGLFSIKTQKTSQVIRIYKTGNELVSNLRGIGKLSSENKKSLKEILERLINELDKES